MDSSLYAGRNVQKQILKSFLSAALGSTGPQAGGTVPRVFLFHGDGGMGKSALVDICIDCVEEISTSTGRPLTSLLLDWDAWRFQNGMLPTTVRSLLDAFYATAAATGELFAEALTPFASVTAKMASQKQTEQRLLKVEWPKHSLLSAETDFNSWLSSRLDPADLAIAENPEGYLTATLVECLARLSLESPFAICIDSMELTSNEDLEGWLKYSFLPNLLTTANNIAVVLSGDSRMVRDFRNELSGELLYPVHLAAMTLSRTDIAALARSKNMPIDQDQASQIESATAGIPLVVQYELDAVAKNIPLTDALKRRKNDVSDAPALVKELVDRFIAERGDETTQWRIFSLAMMFRFDENILASLWNLPASEVTTALTDLACRCSFMPGRRLHPSVRDQIRAYLIDEASSGKNSSLANFFESFASINSNVYSQYLSQIQTEIADTFARWADPSFQITVLGYLRTSLWASQDESMRLLPGFLVEALHCNPEFASQLLGFTGDLEPLLSDGSRATLNALSGVLPVAALLRSPPGELKKGEKNILDPLVKFEATMTPNQQGLLYRMLGELASRAGTVDKAIDAFDASASLLAAGSLEYGLLFEDFLGSACKLLKNDQKKKAAAAFDKAVAINPNDFFSWNMLGRTRQALGDHEKAISALVEAVKIDASSVDAWIELGNEYAALSDHANAAESFSRVTELEPERPLAWFRLGIALEALSRFPEAEKALKRAVGILPDHWEALFALGRSQSAQALALDAIDSLRKTVSVKADCTDAWKALGRELYVTESWTEATEALTMAAKLDPKDPVMLYMLGVSWHRVNDFEKAVESCQKAVDLKPDYFDAWVSLGRSHTESSNFKEAHAAFARAAGLKPGDEEIWVSVGNSLYAQGKYDESITAYRKAAELHPENDSLWHNIGLANQVQRKFTEAIEAYNKAVAINPAVSDTWCQKGRCHAELGQHAEAADCFAKAVEIAPDDHDAWYRKGLSLAKVGNHAEAIAALTRASELNPTDADIWFQAGLSYVSTGSAEDAVKAFSQSLAIAPNRPEALYQLGLAQESLDLREDAAVSYRKSVELAPDKVEAWLHLGLCCNALSRYDEGLPAFRKVLELTPENIEVFLPLALAAHATGAYDDAVAFYRKVIYNNPDSQEAMYNLALALHAQNKLQESLQVYQTVTKKWPANDQAWYNMGLALHAAGNFQQAIISYREATKINPESPEIWYHLGMVFYETEHYGEAIQAFRKVISRAPEMYEAWFNIGNAYLVWNEFNDAAEAYQKAVELRPDDFASWGYLGNAYYGARVFDKAAEASGKAFELKSDEAWVMCTFGLSKVHTGDLAGAAPIFEALLATDSSGQEVARAVAELQKAIAMNPALAGVEEILQKLTGG